MSDKMYVIKTNEIHLKVWIDFLKGRAKTFRLAEAYHKGEDGEWSEFEEGIMAEVRNEDEAKAMAEDYEAEVGELEGQIESQDKIAAAVSGGHLTNMGGNR